LALIVGKPCIPAGLPALPYALVWVLLGAPLACGGAREAGPQTHEYGQTFYWSVTESLAVPSEDCTDAQGWQEEIQPIPYDSSTFIVYRVSRNGERAVPQSCETTEPDSCVDLEGGASYTIEGHTLSYDPPALAFDVANSECDLSADELWTLKDLGETLEMDIVYDYGLDGPQSDCDALEQNVRDTSDNGLGLRDCQVTLQVRADFHSAR